MTERLLSHTLSPLPSSPNSDAATGGGATGDGRVGALRAS